ncbi:ATP-binding protein [Roseimaritima sediminicola]|uniref:ATP-binding protein n=1 Tax=Roseimaritima sediminicola TaxID=2662066 RepID=UPI0012982D78|nr:ATP-binding protein [Roseimaritima sediminicola]
MTDIATIDKWITDAEGENLEFKSARTRYGLDELTEYCVALANEGGGKIILGVTDRRPRCVVGSQAFPHPEETRSQLNQRLHLGITFDVVQHPGGRVLVFHIPSRPVGIPIQFRGKYLVRQDESLVGMSGERLREIYAEAGHDFSADVCPGLTLSDLSTEAIEDFRARWKKKSNNSSIDTLTVEQLLYDIEVGSDEGLTYAALILFGTRQAVRKFRGQAEIVFEYRSTNAAGPAQQREEFCEGFFLYYDRLWELINLRNDKQHYEDGPFVLEVRTFQERAVREAILNAVSHRSYQLGSNVFIRQFPERLEIDSPGGFAPEINPENILVRQSPRNRRIAEVFAKCGLVERAGQGVDLMYQLAIRDSKRTPDYSRSDDYTVSVVMAGQVLNRSFVRFILQCDLDDLESLSTEQWLALEAFSHEQPFHGCSQESLNRLLELKMVERVSSDRYILPRQYYSFLGREAAYERMREREAKKESLEAFLDDFRIDGVAISQIEEILPNDDRATVRAMLNELVGEERAHTTGDRRWTRYFPGPEEG